jgi:hypothetical protein
MVTMKCQFICGALSGPLFILTFIIEGVMRKHYSEVSNPVSMLALGSFGWVQVINFLITGVLVLAFANGLWRRYRTSPVMSASASLIAILAFGIIGAGVFTTDAGVVQLHGLLNQTWHLSLHGLFHRCFAASTFLVLPASSFVMARQFCQWRQTGWAIYSLLSGIGSLLFFFLLAHAIDLTDGVGGYAGLYERISIVIGLGWLSILAVKLLRAPTD